MFDLLQVYNYSKSLLLNSVYSFAGEDDREHSLMSLVGSHARHRPIVPSSLLLASVGHGPQHSTSVSIVYQLDTSQM